MVAISIASCGNKTQQEKSNLFTPSEQEFDYVVDKCEELNQAAHSIGCELNDPFMTMGFLSLPVIPELKITDKGVFDTNKFDFIDIINVTALQA